jgi:hypothetical protein
MDGTLAESYERPATGAWNVPWVADARDALLARGAAQGWLIPRRDLQLGRIIGAGTFGQTYEADWHGVKVRCVLVSVADSRSHASECAVPGLPSLALQQARIRSVRTIRAQLQ